MKRFVFGAFWFLALVIAVPAAGEVNTVGLADATVLIIRHAEKPDSSSGLSPAGEARAKAYVGYFQHLVVDGVRFRPDMLVASTDSPHSARERLTLTPLSQALGLPIDLRFANKHEAALAHALATENHGKSILICWHHGHIPNLIRALGADPNALLPESKWPASVFDWVVALHYDHTGRLVPRSARIIREEIEN